MLAGGPPVEPHSREAPVFVERTSVGLDVHARSVVAVGLDGLTGEVLKARLGPEAPEVLAWIRQLPGPVRVVYEAGPTGFGLARALIAENINCLVAAPSKISRPAGDRVKTDARDAMLLARLLRVGDIVPVRVPSEDEEAARDLVRAREDVRGDLMRARHRLSKLLRHGAVLGRQGSVDAGARRVAAPAGRHVHPAGVAGGIRRRSRGGADAVSYTHLTLPTICSV